MSQHPVEPPSSRAGSCGGRGSLEKHSRRTNGILYTQSFHRCFLRTGPVRESLFSWSSQAGLRLPGDGRSPVPCSSSLHGEAVAWTATHMPVMLHLAFPISASLQPRPTVLGACWTFLFIYPTGTFNWPIPCLLPHFPNSAPSFFSCSSDNSCTHLGPPHLIWLHLCPLVWTILIGLPIWHSFV